MAKTFLEGLNEEAKSLSGMDRKLIEPLLEELDAMRGMVEELRKAVLKEGALIEVEKGGANNRHKELVENPALTAYSKLVGRYSDLSKKVSGFAKGSDTEEEDSLDAFIRR